MKLSSRAATKTTIAFFSFVLAIAAHAEDVTIDSEKFVLDNGLTLIVHEDHKAPIVAVNVWYHVGSKNEKEGKTGFAHLFEHLMFNGSENFNDDWFKPFDRVGATGLNGTTNFDRTNYFEVVPNNALDFALWMESDRMGHLLGAIDQDKLDEQRGVVQNEKRQGENQPYGKVFITAFKNIFPKGHPYSWSVIGYMEDLEAASLDDVHEWFSQYYGAANAVLVVAGDVEAEDVKERVEHYFGHIPAGPPLIRQDTWIPDLVGTHRQVLQDRVPQARLYKIWMMPEIGNIEADQLDLVAGILSEGKSSRLYKRLVHDDRIASDVNAFAFPLEIAGLFGVIATAMPGQDLAAVEAAIDEEVDRFLADGPTRDELTRITTTRKAAFVRGAERVGGFGGKSDILATNEVYLGDPGAYKDTLRVWDTADGGELTRVANKWMARGQYVLEVQPYEERTVATTTVDRSRFPDVGEQPQVRFDGFERAQLSNGLTVILAERSAIPVVNMRMMVNAGYAADQFGLPGTATLAMNMLDEGTKNRTAIEISDELAVLGATLGAGSNLDVSTVSMSALKENFAASLDLFVDVILNPVFPQDDFVRLRDLQLAGIKQEKVQPVGMGLRVFGKLLYGDNHAYGLPMTGSGTEESVLSLDTDALKRFHGDWFNPNNATLVVVGDVTMEELRPQLEKQFSKWPRGDSPRKDIGTVAQQAKSTVYLVDRPESEQSIIFAGHVAPPKNNDREIAIEAMNEVLGGSFAARINMNLREDKHWAYGARSLVLDAQGQRPFVVYAPVQTDKTSESMAEIYKEVSQIRGERPPTADEVARAKDKKTLTLPGRWETANSVANSLAEMVRFGLPDNHWDEYPDMVRSLSDEQILDVAVDVIKPDNMVWVVVGDRAEIEEDIKELGYGDIVLMDADGNVLEDSG
ncbi:MAG: insulinase family protein [Gammaproteobacteria bacterium]|nr:insulinase family protein [Gammaproteobacteria bacterium]